MSSFTITFGADIEREPDDETDDQLLAYVVKAARDWLPEGFIFMVTMDENGKTKGSDE